MSQAGQMMSTFEQLQKDINDVFAKDIVTLREPDITKAGAVKPPTPPTYKLTSSQESVLRLVNRSPVPSEVKEALDGKS